MRRRCQCCVDCRGAWGSGCICSALPVRPIFCGASKKHLAPRRSHWSSPNPHSCCRSPLTAGRRFQLAAEAGRTTGLMLIQTDAGSNATESRWACEPQASPEADSTLQHWLLKKNKRGTPGDWVVNWNAATTAFHMVVHGSILSPTRVSPRLLNC